MIESHFASLYPDNSRFDEIEQVLTFVKEGNACQIVGLPGVGKSNVLELLAYNRAVRIKHLGDDQTNFHFVPVNFSEVRNRELFDITKFIFLELVESFEERGLTKIYETTKDIFKEALSYNDELVLFQGLKKTMDFLTLENNLTIVLLFDRFETYIPKVTPEFFNNLRILRSRAKYKFSAVFSVNRPLEDSIEITNLVDYYEFLIGHTIYLPLEDKPGMNFRINYLMETTKQSLSDKQIAEVLQITAYHGKLTRLCIEALFASPDAELPSKFFLEKQTVIGALLEIWHSLTPAEQKLLLDQSPELYENRFLHQIGILKGDTIAIPLFEVFLETKRHELSQTNQKITFDGIANTIKKGDVIISEQLTVSEFRLLRFLLTHPDLVVDREDIIAAVWTDAKATAGVTDQAVDQLVFRVRKKIEADPNNPLHIQTIKGRGIRFVA